MSLRMAAWLIAFLVVAGCASREVPPPPGEVRARLDMGSETIRVTVANLRPSDRVDRLRLVGPEDRRIAPTQRGERRGTKAMHRNPSVGVHAEGGSASGIRPGISLSFGLFDWIWSRDTERRLRAVTATFPVPDGYTEQPGEWRVEAVLMGQMGHRITRSADIRQSPAR